MNLIPQIIPIKWFLIYFIYLLIFYLFIILINSILIKTKINKETLKIKLKKWNWFW